MIELKIDGETEYYADVRLAITDAKQLAKEQPNASIEVWNGYLKTVAWCRYMYT